MTGTRRHPLAGPGLGPRRRRRAGVVAAVLAACSCASAPRHPAGERPARPADLEAFDTVWTTIDEGYFDPSFGGVDWERARRELRPEAAAARTVGEVRAVIGTLLGRLGASHLGLIPAELLETMGRPPGRGAPGGETGIDARLVDGALLVTEVRSGTPAERAGIRRGWEIVAADGAAVRPLAARLQRELPASSARELILTAALRSRLTGAVGRRVAVVLADGRGRERRVLFELEEPAGHRFSIGLLENLVARVEVRELDGDIGYVALDGFIDPLRVVPAFADAVERLRAARGLVVDVRGNGGGMLPVVTGIAGFLVGGASPSLGVLRTREATLRAVVNPRRGAFAGPLAVLVDGLAASGAEVFAAGLRSLGRARIFGTTSSGMVLGGRIVHLPNGDALLYPFAGFTTTSGTALEGAGVVPDVEVRLSRESLLAGRDPVVDAAVDWIASTYENAAPAVRESARRR